jgi:uncharacterized membrane protein YozB (DUF420 family)
MKLLYLFFITIGHCTGSIQSGLVLVLLALQMGWQDTKELHRDVYDLDKETLRISLVCVCVCVCVFVLSLMAMD